MLKNNPTLTERCEHVFEQILKKNITVEMIAQVFSNLKVKGYNYTDIKTALLNAGDIEPRMETDIYTREEIMRLFNWQDRALRDNLERWGLPHLLSTYKKVVVHQAAMDNGWYYDAPYGAWCKKKRKEKASYRIVWLTIGLRLFQADSCDSKKIRVIGALPNGFSLRTIIVYLLERRSTPSE